MLTSSKAAAHTAPAADALAPLPRDFVRAVFLSLPVDARLRCTEVCRSWRAFLDDASLFARLNLSTTSGIRTFGAPLFRAAVAKAGGRLASLDLTGWAVWRDRLTTLTVLVFEALRAAAADNAATLEELRLHESAFSVNFDQVSALLRACPNLRVLEVDLRSDNVAAARRMLRTEPPFGPLRVRDLNLGCFEDDAGNALAEFLFDVSRHASLISLSLFRTPLGSVFAMNALVDTATGLNLRDLSLDDCGLVPACLPPLTRLVAAGFLRQLFLNGPGGLFADEELVRFFVDAVRASALTNLRVRSHSAHLNEAMAFINDRASLAGITAM